MKNKGSDTGLEFSSGLGLNQSCLRAFAAMAKTLGQSLPMDMILTATLDLTLADAGVEAGEIYLLDEKGQELIYACHRGLSEDCVQEARWVPVKLGEGVTGRVAALKEPIVVPKLSEKDQFCRESPRREGYRSLISLPIKSGDRVYGVINLFSRNDRRLSPRYVQWLADSMELLGVALEDVQPFDGNNIRIKELEEAEEKYRHILGATPREGERGTEANIGAGIIEILDALPFYVMLVDAEHHILMANKAVTHHLGLDPEQIVGAYCPKIVHGLDSPFPGCPLEEAVKKGHAVSRELFDPNSGRWLDSAVYPTSYRTQDGLAIFLHMVHDITARKRAEEALRESEERYRQLVSGLQDAYMILQEGKIVFANEKLVEMSGYDLREVIGMKMAKLWPPHLRKQGERLFQQALQGEKLPERVEGRILTKKGAIVPIEATIKLLDYEGKPSISSIFRDISERKRAEEALRRSEEHFRSLIENISDIIAVVNSDGTIGYASPSVEWVLGYEPKELTGRSPFDFIHPDDLQNVANIFAELIQNRSSAPSAEIRIRQKDGSWRFVEAKYKSILNDSGTASTVINARDITERKRAEQALRESEQRLRALIENAPDAIYVNDLVGNFVDGNRKAEELIGFSREELIGKNFFEAGILPEEYVPNALAALEKGRRGEPTGPEEFELVTKEGSRVSVEITSFPVARRGTVEVLGIARDITARKQAEEALQQQAHDLSERVKELICLYGTSALTAKQDISSEELLQGTLDLIPPAWQYPEITCARIILEDQEFRTENFRDTIWKQTQDINLHDERIGTLEVCYLEERPESDDGPFLKEERGLIEAIAARVGETIERKRAEQALRDSEEMSRGMVESAATGIYIVQDGKFQYVSPQVEHISGYTSDELIGTYSLDYILPEDREAARKGAIENLKGLTSSPHEFRFVRKDGQPVWFLEKVASIQYRGEQAAVGSLLDIAKIKLAEEALRESEAKYRILVDSAPDAIVLVDLEGRIISCNSATEVFTGYDAEELQGKSFLELSTIEPEDLPRVTKFFEDIMLSRDVEDFEMKSTRKDGSERWMGVKVRILKSEETITGILVIGRDITERKRADEALRASEEKYRELIEDINDGYLVINIQDSRIVFANSKAAQMLGYQNEELVGADYARFVTQERIADTNELRQTIARGGPLPDLYETLALKKDGTKVALEVSMKAFDYEGKPAASVIARDITEKKRAEEALQKNEERFRALVENAFDCTMVVGTDETIQYVSPSLSQVLGYEPEEWVGKKTFSFLHPDDMPTIVEASSHGISILGHTTFFEVRFRHKDGSWRNAETVGRNLLANRAVQGIVINFRDITERKQADEALRQRTEELEKAYEELKAMHDFMIKSARLRALGEMASGVAHDFNNILSIIIGRAQLALEETKDPGVVNTLQIIEETGLDGAQTVRRLQDFARVRVDHDFDSVDLNAIVKSAVQMVEPRRAERQETGSVVIDIYTELEKLAPVNGNPSELKEALVNTLFNAMDAMPDGGKITIKTMVENDRVVVSISDTGAGMTDEIKSKIFDPFFSTKGHHGLGMGLSVTYGIIARHKGIIDVDSVPGKGTSFHIKLPAATRTKKKARNSSITPSVDGANILLVDDSPQVSEVLKLILNQMGHYVTEVNNGKEAISTFEKGDYTLVITDLGMPDMSGREVARAIKERKPKTPVILITGWGVQLDPEEMRKVGIDGVVPKPLSREALSVQIAGLLPSSSRE